MSGPLTVSPTQSIKNPSTPLLQDSTALTETDQKVVHCTAPNLAQVAKGFFFTGMLIFLGCFALYTLVFFSMISHIYYSFVFLYPTVSRSGGPTPPSGYYPELAPKAIARRKPKREAQTKSSAP